MKINKTVCDACYQQGLDSTAAITLKVYETNKPVTRGAPVADNALDLCLGCYNDVEDLLRTPRLNRVKQAT